MALSLPGDDDRTVIVGSTGSGKTFAGIWLLSNRNWYERPTYIFDFKGDALIASLPATLIGIRNPPPRDPGLYVVRPLPEQDDDAVAEFMRQIWVSGDCILYIDEGYMIQKSNKWFNALLTQGRSKLIEIITLSQRPLWLSRFVFSEATYFGIFNLTDRDDRKTVGRFVPTDLYTSDTWLERHHWIWYSVAQGEGRELDPVPGRAQIIARFYVGNQEPEVQEQIAKVTTVDTLRKRFL